MYTVSTLYSKVLCIIEICVRKVIMVSAVYEPRAKRKIILAQAAGFCFGVKRAVEMTQEARITRVGKLTTLGPIIHNEQVIDRMRGAGIDTALTLDLITEGTVVMSAHGVAPSQLAQARAQGLQILDVTCPFVTKVHRTAKQLYEQGYQILLVGDKGHTEVRGIVGAVEEIGGSVIVISLPHEIEEFELGKKVAIVCQTTQNSDNYARIVAEVCRTATDVRAINTICNATDELQDAAVRMARQCDVAIVVGGRKSANTQRLRTICEAQGIPAYHIETVEEIEETWLEGKAVIGITAGASTPDWIIEEVAAHLNYGQLPPDWNLHHPNEKC